MFSHRDAMTLSSFISIHTSTGTNLELSPGHYLYVNGRLTAAKHVKVGDILEVKARATTRAMTVGRVRKRGLYNPQTVSGDIVVADVQVSTYTSALDPMAAVALMAPLRMAHMCSSNWPRWISNWLAHGTGSWTSYLCSGLTMFV